MPVRPDVARKALSLTSAFEGHASGRAAGDFDGEILTWGPLGFALRSGSLHGVLRRIAELDPSAFPADFAMALRQGREATADYAWTRILRPADRFRIRPEWQRLFTDLYRTPAAQQAFAEAAARYARKAEAICRAFGFTGERGYCLAFDIAVQNGGVRARAQALWRDIKVRWAADPDHATDEEWVRMKALAYAVADAAKPRWREDVLSRKLCIAVGRGRVHGRDYDLWRDFGIGYAEPWEEAAA